MNNFLPSNVNQACTVLQIHYFYGSSAQSDCEHFRVAQGFQLSQASYIAGHRPTLISQAMILQRQAQENGCFQSSHSHY